MDGIRNFTEAEKKIYGAGENTGFVAAFLIFGSMLFLILNLRNNLPDYVRYWHFAAASAIIGSIIVIAKKAIGKE